MSASATPAAPPSPSSATTRLDLAAGAAMGLLLGALVGLSTTPVVATVISGVAALVGGLLGIGTTTSAQSPVNLNTWRVVGFGFAFVPALLWCVTLRTHHTLEPSLKAQIEELAQAGVEPKYAQELVMFRAFGVQPANRTVSANDNQVHQTVGGLFATSADVCNQLARAHDQDVPSRIQGLARGGNATEKFVNFISAATPDSRKALLDLTELALCQ